jgi:hypothetical protein
LSATLLPIGFVVGQRVNRGEYEPKLTAVVVEDVIEN